MQVDPQLVRRVESIEARIALSELRAKYAWYIAHGAASEVADLFTEDGIFEMYETAERVVTMKGRDVIRERLSAVPDGVRVPLVTNEIFSIDGDRARGTCAMHSPVSPGQSGGFGGHYVDELQRVRGTWLFSRRTFYYYWPIYSADRNARPD